MPVHAAGPRLFSTIPFQHLAQTYKGGGKTKAVNVSLNLVPFVDMMTILVCFLLMVFSASGDILMAQKGLELPHATNKDVLQRAPVIIVTRESITFNGEHMAEVESIVNDASPQWKVVELFERMKQERQLFLLNFDKLPPAEKQRCEDATAGKPLEPGRYCLDGLAIMQADKSTEAKVINRLLKTANAAGYTNVMFAVNRRAGAGGGGGAAK
jgi:biopolymer transport protein ExbD